MTSMPSDLYKDVFAVSRDILDCDTFDDLYFAALQGLERVLDAATSCLLLAPGNDPKQLLVGGLSHGVDESGLASYLSSYQMSDPIARRTLEALNISKSEVLRLDQVVDYRSFRNTRFYNEFYRPNGIHHVIGIGMRCGLDTIGLVGLHRPANRPGFTTEDLEKARLFVPSLSAALTKTMALERLQDRDWLIGTLADSCESEAVLILNDALGVIFANRTAANLFEQQQGAAASRIKLPTALTDACLEIRPHAANSAPPMERTISLPHSPRLKAVIEPLVGDDRRLRYLIKVSDFIEGGVTTSAIASMGLTRREAAIADLVATGLSNPQIADRLSISVRTVENHLRSVFDKAGVHNRTALAFRLSNRAA